MWIVGENYWYKYNKITYKICTTVILSGKNITRLLIKFYMFN